MPEWNPTGESILVRYRNYHGELREFTADAATIRQKHAHISLRVAPTGKRIALARNRIQNLDEVLQKQQENPQPSRRERQVLAFHLKRGSTSPLFEEIRQRFPAWKPPSAGAAPKPSTGPEKPWWKRLMGG